MIRVVMGAMLVGLLVLRAGATGWTADADGSRLTIVSPTQGEVSKGDSVQVRYKLSKGTGATHIQDMVKGLTRGSHEIKLVAASYDHDALGAEAVVTIEVE